MNAATPQYRSPPLTETTYFNLVRYGVLEHTKHPERDPCFVLCVPTEMVERLRVGLPICTITYLCKGISLVGFSRILITV